MKYAITRTVCILIAFFVIGSCETQILPPTSENGSSKQTPQQLLGSVIPVSSMGVSALSESDDGLKKSVLQIYHLKEQCILDILHGSQKMYLGVPVNERPVLEFKNSDIDFRSSSFTLFEEALSPRYHLRAFTGQPVNSRNVNLYLEDQGKGYIQEIDWNRFIHSRPINEIQWIEDGRLLFAHSTGSQITEVGVIEIQEKNFVLYWLVDNHCK